MTDNNELVGKWHARARVGDIKFILATMKQKGITIADLVDYDGKHVESHGERVAKHRNRHVHIEQHRAQIKKAQKVRSGKDPVKEYQENVLVTPKSPEIRDANKKQPATRKDNRNSTTEKPSAGTGENPGISESTGTQEQGSGPTPGTDSKAE